MLLGLSGSTTAPMSMRLKAVLTSAVCQARISLITKAPHVDAYRQARSQCGIVRYVKILVRPARASGSKRVAFQSTLSIGMLEVGERSGLERVAWVDQNGKALPAGFPSRVTCGIVGRWRNTRIPGCGWLVEPDIVVGATRVTGPRRPRRQRWAGLQCARAELSVAQVERQLVRVRSHALPGLGHE